jgi:hypothetical protein
VRYHYAALGQPVPEGTFPEPDPAALFEAP